MKVELDLKRAEPGIKEKMEDVALTPPSDAIFEDGVAEFLPATFENVAARLIRESFPPLLGRSIQYLWKRRGGRHGGLPVMGKCQIPTGLLAHYAGRADNIWAAGFAPKQVEAILFHELCHAQIDEEGQPKIVAHEFEGFRREIERYGCWEDGLAAMRDVVQEQLRLL